MPHCQLCEKPGACIRKIEGLRICHNCRTELGIPSPSAGPVRYRTSKRANIHISGQIACPPRPYGQLPGNGSY